MNGKAVVKEDKPKRVHPSIAQLLQKITNTKVNMKKSPKAQNPKEYQAPLRSPSRLKVFAYCRDGPLHSSTKFQNRLVDIRQLLEVTTPIATKDALDLKGCRSSRCVQGVGSQPAGIALDDRSRLVLLLYQTSAADYVAGEEPPGMALDGASGRVLSFDQSNSADDDACQGSAGTALDSGSRCGRGSRAAARSFLNRNSRSPTGVAALGQWPSCDVGAWPQTWWPEDGVQRSESWWPQHNAP